jgi:hypothetical protein
MVPEDAEVVDHLANMCYLMLSALQGHQVSIRRLKRLLFGPKTEKAEKVLSQKKAPQAAGDGKGDGAGGRDAKKKSRKPPGHGRNGEADYSGAQTVNVTHHSLKPGDGCPGCHMGKVYEQRTEPGILVRVTGQAPLAATIYHLQKLRCGDCGETFEARPPEGVGDRKYDEPAAAMIALLRYGAGLPFFRLQRLQGNVGIPLPVSTQWEIVRDASEDFRPAWVELIRQAAQGKVLYHDDTDMRILEWMGKRLEKKRQLGIVGDEEKNSSTKPDRERKGIFTSGIVSTLPARAGERPVQIALYFTGRRHAGENLKSVLEKRNPESRKPIQMCDPLARNMPKELRTIIANCLTHGRRQFVDLVTDFPDECRFVIDLLAKVYRYDEIAKIRKMTPSKRLKFHQLKSGPLMKRLRRWMRKQFTKKKVEPNSALGAAFNYMLKRWRKFTRFLWVSGAPLDNTICERALKKAILHRKNSLFYKTDRGAEVGDIFMSLIHTCELNGVDAFDYLVQVQIHAKEVQAHPEQWMPWNYTRKARAPDAARSG